ncbi:MAG: M48 family metalloprotease [Acidimicrobiales bacterium]
MAQALEKLENYANRVPAAVDPNQASAYIVNPLRSQLGGGGMSRLFSTHPPTEERIRRLRNL